MHEDRKNVSTKNIDVTDVVVGQTETKTVELNFVLAMSNLSG